MNDAVDTLMNKPAPNFNLPNQEGAIVSLDNFKDSWIVLYFYPKDNTPGCIKEACAFRDNYDALKNINAHIIGISKDEQVSHQKFIQKYDLPFTLLSDSDGGVARDYNALSPINSTQRKTYLITPEKIIAKIYEKVTPASHPEEILQDLTLLKNQN